MQQIQPKESWFTTLLRYHKFHGSWGWIFHRLAGLGLTLYIFLHIIMLTNLQRGAEAYNEEMMLFRTFPFRLLTIGLFSILIFHTLNGVRIALVDFADWSRYQRLLHKWVWALSVLSAVGMGYLIIVK